MSITNTLCLIQLAVMLVLEIAVKYSLMLTVDNVLITVISLMRNCFAACPVNFAQRRLVTACSDRICTWSSAQKFIKILYEQSFICGPILVPNKL